MRLPATCSADMLSMYSGTLPKLLSKPSFNIMLEHNTAAWYQQHDSNKTKVCHGRV